MLQTITTMAKAPEVKDADLPPIPEEEEFDEMTKFLQALKMNPKGDQTKKIANMMKDYLQSTGQLEDTTGTKHKDKKTLTLPHEKKPTVFDQLTPPPGSLPQSGFPPPPQTPPVSISQQPKLTCFSGSGNKGETTYDVWRYNVKCLLKEKVYRPDVLHSTIRQSLRNEAARVVMRLGTDATMNQILDKLDSIYGNVEKKEELLAEFYSARQREDEDITSWSCRLEDIIGKALELGVVQHAEVDKMLHSMLWTGLRQELKDISSHKYDTVKGFDQLRVVLRQIEKDHMPQKTSGKGKSAAATSKSAVTKDETSHYEELKGMINQLTKKVTGIEENQKHTPQHIPPPTQYNNRGRGYQRGYGNRRGTYHPPRSNSWPRQPYQQNQMSSWTPRPTYQKWNNQPTYTPPPWNESNAYQPIPSQTWTQQPTQPKEQDIQCRRCGQYGHIQIGCRVRLDHLKSDLNANKPMTQGHS